MSQSSSTNWRKSRRSGSGSGNCVEVAVVTGQEQFKR
ncbi:DUF397 domain-containing protein [Actinoallomurus purpureus]|nr:DUF397 domain-containing protein [Actinoallomurus purpureus]MCO6010703.1 DUF397 domain-containing protein [Actinoallomurus purpureus]